MKKSNLDLLLEDLPVEILQGLRYTFLSNIYISTFNQLILNSYLKPSVEVYKPKFVNNTQVFMSRAIRINLIYQ
jgi:hypothetical protein